MQYLRYQRHVGEDSALAGAIAVAPLAGAIGVLGVIFGCLARARGFGALAAVVMSATTFAGSPQFAAVGILGAGGSVAAAVGAAALLAARLVPMSAVAAPALAGGPWQRCLVAQLVVDESWAVALHEVGRFSRQRLIGAGVLLWVVHVASTALGAVVAAAIRRPERWGVDAAFPALFLMLLWPQLRHPERARAAVSGALVALALTPFTPQGVPLLVAAAVALLPHEAWSPGRREQRQPAPLGRGRSDEA